MGFQPGALDLQCGWTGPVTLTDWTTPVSATASTVRPARDHRVSRSAGKPDAEWEEIRAINRRLDGLLAKVAKL